MNIEIFQFTQKDINENNLKQINHLLNVLSQNIQSLTAEKLGEIIAQNNFYLFVAKDQEKIIGLASVYFQRLLSKKTSWVEDVVVDENYQGQGLGKKLTQKLIAKAKELNIINIDLTSSPYRLAANSLYQKLGWQKRETNVYRLKLK
jgi:ribosomal protein S18 acetylase RimI-like enzyme